MDITEQMPILDQLPPDVRSIILQVLLLVIALFIIWILRNVIKWLIFQPVRNMLQYSQSPLTPVILDAIQRPSRLVVLSAGIYITVALFEFGVIEVFAVAVARAILFIAAFVALYGIIDVLFDNVKTLEALTGIEVEKRLLPFLSTLVKGTILVIGALIVLQEFGVDVTALIASFGVIGLALSLAAKDTAANFFSFAAILSDNPFQVGDYVSTQGFDGTVEHVGVRTTRIRKLDQSLVIMPNSKLTDNAVINWSRLTKRRMDFTLQMTYTTKLHQLRDLIDQVRAMLYTRPLIEKSSITVYMVKLNNSSLDVRVICNVLIREWNGFAAETEAINLAVIEIVENLGLQFAFPTQSLYIENLGSQEEIQSVKRYLSTDEMKAVRPSGDPNQAN